MKCGISLIYIVTSSCTVIKSSRKLFSNIRVRESVSSVLYLSITSVKSTSQSTNEQQCGLGCRKCNLLTFRDIKKLSACERPEFRGGVIHW